MTAFMKTLFPTDISHGSVGGPEFLTEVVEMRSGLEQRNCVRKVPRARYNIGYGIKTQEQLDRVRALHYIARGRAYGFLFRDPIDSKAVLANLGIGDGITKKFPITKTYRLGDYTFTRRITKPVREGFQVFVAGKENDTWKLDDDLGFLMLNEPLQRGKIVQASFDFNVPVRFETDYLPVKLEGHNIVSLYDIELREILHEPSLEQ